MGIPRPEALVPPEVWARDGCECSDVKAQLEGILLEFNDIRYEPCLGLNERQNHHAQLSEGGERTLTNP